jgi:hypothetical protein
MLVLCEYPSEETEEDCKEEKSDLPSEYRNRYYNNRQLVSEFCRMYQDEAMLNYRETETNKEVRIYMQRITILTRSPIFGT